MPLITTPTPSMESRCRSRYASGGDRSSSWQNWIRAPHIASFERRYAEMLGVDVDSGRLQRFRTVAGSFAAYQHEVTIQTLVIDFSAVVFFAQDSTFNRTFLGRSGWLDRLRIAIVDYDRLLFVSPYQS